MAQSVKCMSGKREDLIQSLGSQVLKAGHGGVISVIPVLRRQVETGGQPQPTVQAA